MAYRINGALARFRRALVAASLAFGFAASAHADFINIYSDASFSHSGVGSFTGSIEYLAQTGQPNGTLLITLTNTSDQFGGGYITGFVFNAESSDPNIEVTLINGPSGFATASGQNAGSFGGPFDAGAALGGHFMGGGNFTAGIAGGETVAFEFKVSAADAESLSATSFMTGSLPFNFVVRFRGFTGGGQDIVPVQGSALPGPSALVATALFIALVRWRKRDTPKTAQTS